MSIKKYIPWVLLLVLLLWNPRKGKIDIVEKHTTDTLIVFKCDTLLVTKVKTVESPSDTVYITIRDSIPVPVPRQEYTFSQQDVFDFRVKGTNVEFLDAKVYPKTVYKTITNETIIIDKAYRSSLFVSAGFSSICGTFAPEASVSLSLKGKWLISTDFAIYRKEPLWGVKVGYNILHK